MTGKDRNPKLGEVERSFEPGEQDGYQADNVSRNDQAGVAADDFPETPSDDDATSSIEATPDAQRRKATDDADSREARPPRSPREGGVR